MCYPPGGGTPRSVSAQSLENGERSCTNGATSGLRARQTALTSTFIIGLTDHRGWATFRTHLWHDGPPNRPTGLADHRITQVAMEQAGV